MSYSVACSVSCSVAEHTLGHGVLERMEDASKAAYDLVKGIFKFDDSVGILQEVCSNDLCGSKDELARIRAEIDSVNHQLNVSNLHVETLRLALDLSRDVRASLQTRHAELTSCTNKVVESSGHVTRLPQEVISHIASFLYDEKRGAWGYQASHVEWAKTVYRPASESLYFLKDLENHLRLVSGSLDEATDGDHPLSVHCETRDIYLSQSKYVSSASSEHPLFSTTHRWRELYLNMKAHPNTSDILNHCAAGLPSLSHLGIFYGTTTNRHDSLAPLPTWWHIFVERFGREGRTSPVPSSASVPLRFLSSSDGLFSSVRHLQVNLLIHHHSSSELSSAFCNMHHLTTLKIWFPRLQITTNANDDQMAFIKLPSLKELTIGGISIGLPIVNTMVDAFECKNLQIFTALLSGLASQSRPEGIANLLISAHDSFPTLNELFVQIARKDSNAQNDWGPDPIAISQSIIQSLSFPAKDDHWLLPHLTTLALPSVPGRNMLRVLVTLGHNRRTNDISARLLHLKLITQDFTRRQECDDMFQSLLMHYHDVVILNSWDYNDLGYSSGSYT
ncbi:hypothetical protein BD410DRAFT_844589 [Rickenella mellea]|uniref:Uncharacterized protein n=1 Tax=Rickenella mellea TaxID=50990 RepID=A0A4Y7PP26_9AGAM|nr:hypothetical protein BD410DRAFT_844589 [Rickenella mellea]